MQATRPAERQTSAGSERSEESEWSEESERSEGSELGEGSEEVEIVSQSKNTRPS